MRRIMILIGTIMEITIKAMAKIKVKIIIEIPAAAGVYL